MPESRKNYVEVVPDAWVTKLLDDVLHKRMIITHCKDLVEGDYLINDRSKNGTCEFKEGEEPQVFNNVQLSGPHDEVIVTRVQI